MSAATPVQRALLGILTTASSCSTLVSSRTPPNSFPVASVELDLPIPPPIDEALSALCISSSLAIKLSKAYQEFAWNLKQASEAILRRAIFACAQIDTGFDAPVDKSGPIRDAVVRVYMSTLQSMAKNVITLYERRRVPQLHNLLLPNVPHIMSPEASRHSAEAARDGHLASSPEGSHSSNTFEVRWTAGSSARALQTEKGFSWSLDRAGRLPINNKISSGQIVSQATPTQNFVSDPPRHAFPIRYTHSQMSSSPSLPSSSCDFFDHVRPRVRTQSPTPEKKGLSFSQLSEELKGLCIGGCHARSQSDNVAPPHAPNPSFTRDSTLGSSSSMLEERSSKEKASCRENGSDVSLTSNKTPRRKLVPIPRRAQISSGPVFQRSISSHLSEPLHPSPTLVAFNTTLRTPHDDQYGPSLGLVMGVAPSRRRKVAPLPRREPKDAIPHRDTSVDPTHVGTIALPAPRRRSPCSSSGIKLMSRTPSLVSLASSRSVSPSLTDDTLQTPPPSPTMRLTDSRLCSPTSAPTSSPPGFVDPGYESHPSKSIWAKSPSLDRRYMVSSFPSDESRPAFHF